MGHAWLSLPDPKILIDGEDFTQYYSSMAIRRRENGFDTATINIVPPKTTLFYGDTINNDDPIVISYKDKSETVYTTLLSGVIRRIEPALSMEGQFLKIECDGSGYGLGVTPCGEEYGSESTNPTLDTIKEILEDDTTGIIDAWVNNVLGDTTTPTASGYNYTTQVETVAGAIKYVYFPYKTNTKAINDLCDIVQGIKGANAGVHWIVDTSNRFLLATVGNHGAPASTFWPTWWKTDRAGSTLTEGEDFLAFNGQTLSKEANYVLYHGRLRKPATGDFWTENNSSLWDASNGAVADENSIVKIGSYSLKFSPTEIGGSWIDYPSSHDASWNISNCGGEHNIPTLSFWAYNNTGAAFAVRLYSHSGGNVGYFTLSSLLDPPATTWTGYTIPIGDYAKKDAESLYWVPAVVIGSPSWSDIDYIQFMFYSDSGEAYIDGLRFDGWVLRGARQAAAYTAAAPLKMKVITDNVAKDDSLVASDDTGLMGRLAYAEYLRLSSTPIVGTFICPIMPTLKAGQLIHIHAWKKSDGTYAIDDDFRVMRLVHTFAANGITTTMQVTDDILNSNPRPIPDQYNTILNATKPEFQDRQATSIKARDIDITQPILEKTY